MEHGWHRDSHDIGEMCADLVGWRKIRSRAKNRPMGKVFKRAPELARDVRADKFGEGAFSILRGITKV